MSAPEYPLPFSGENAGQWIWRVQQARPEVTLAELGDFAGRRRLFAASAAQRIRAIETMRRIEAMAAEATTLLLARVMRR